MSPELHALVGPYVLDALDPAERRSFEEHLDRCEACRSEVAELEEVPGVLAASVAVPVPASLRASVLGAVDHQRQDRGQLRPAVPAWRRGALVAAAAAVLLVAALAGLAWRGAEDRAARAEVALSVFTAPDREHLVLEGELGRLEVTSSASAGRSVVLGQEVPDLAAGRTYELWFIDEGPPRPAGTFRPEDGRVVLEVPAAAGATVAVTEEPAGGSPQPTGEILASASFGG